MRPYLGPPWTDSHPIWAVDVFHYDPPIQGIQNTEIQKKFFFCDVIASVLYMGDVSNILGDSLIWCSMCSWSIWKKYPVEKWDRVGQKTTATVGVWGVLGKICFSSFW